MTELSAFAERVMSAFAKSITDKVFLMIQEDRGLMHDYLKLVEAHGLTPVNQYIGKKVKERFSLTNDMCRQENPESTLIQSHQEFE
jgi:hypothetical protein